MTKSRKKLTKKVVPKEEIQDDEDEDFIPAPPSNPPPQPLKRAVVQKKKPPADAIAKRRTEPTSERKKKIYKRLSLPDKSTVIQRNSKDIELLSNINEACYGHIRDGYNMTESGKDYMSSKLKYIDTKTGRRSCFGTLLPILAGRCVQIASRCGYDVFTTIIPREGDGILPFMFHTQPTPEQAMARIFQKFCTNDPSKPENEKNYSSYRITNDMYPHLNIQSKSFQLKFGRSIPSVLPRSRAYAGNKKVPPTPSKTNPAQKSVPNLAYQYITNPEKNFPQWSKSIDSSISDIPDDLAEMVGDLTADSLKEQSYETWKKWVSDDYDEETEDQLQKRMKVLSGQYSSSKEPKYYSGSGSSTGRTNNPRKKRSLKFHTVHPMVISSENGNVKMNFGASDTIIIPDEQQQQQQSSETSSVQRTYEFVNCIPENVYEGFIPNIPAATTRRRKNIKTEKHQQSTSCPRQSEEIVNEDSMNDLFLTDDILQQALANVDPHFTFGPEFLDDLYISNPNNHTGDIEDMIPVMNNENLFSPAVSLRKIKEEIFGNDQEEQIPLPPASECPQPENNTVSSPFSHRNALSKLAVRIKTEKFF